MALNLDQVVSKAIPSPNYSGRGGKDVRLLLLHTAEGSRTNTSLGSWFSRKSTGASSHVGIDSGGVVRFVPEVYSAWTARSANPVASQAELCGFAKWGAGDWGAQASMLEHTARWLAAAARYHDIPLTRLRESQTKAGRGVAMHVDITRGWREGSHTDCGQWFADHVLDDVIERARALAGGAGSPVVVPTVPTPVVSGARGPYGLPTLICDGKESGWAWLAQECLQRAGHKLARDGQPGGETRRAVVAQQARYGLTQSGVVDGWTWVTFVADAGDPLRQGMAKGHPGVEVLQNFCGLRGTDLDRVFGAGTAQRVRSIQTWAGFTGSAVDAVVGGDTRAVLATRAY